MTSHIPEFGLRRPGVEYVLRPGGYTVILRATGEVAVVSTPSGLALQGGGEELAESPEQAALRETLEECGLMISIKGLIGVADELVFAADEGRHYRKRCSFFVAEAFEEIGEGEPDHQLIWLTPEKARVELRHESQRWVVANVFGLT